MKKIFWGMLLALIACVGTPAQNQPQFTGAGILIFSGVPTGTCTPNLAVDQATGGIYYCASGTWTSTGGGGAPSGPITAGDLAGSNYPSPIVATVLNGKTPLTAQVPGQYQANSDPPLVQSYTIAATGAQTAINLTAAPIDSHTIQWRPIGTVSTCSVQLDTSPDGTTWTSAGAIASQTCTTAGQAAVSNLNANYVRVNVTVLTGGGSLQVTYAGRLANPAPGNPVSNAIWVQAGETVFANFSGSNITTQGMDLQIRLHTPDGNLATYNTGSINVTCSGAIMAQCSPVLFAAAPQSGWLEMAQASVVPGTVSTGQMVVQIMLGCQNLGEIGTGSITSTVFNTCAPQPEVLQQSATNGFGNVAWPQNLPLWTSGPGFPITTTVSNPSAGAQALYTPSNKIRHQIIGVSFQIAASATVANRYAQLTLECGSTYVALIQSNTAQTASTTVWYSFLPGIAPVTGGAGGIQSLPMPANGFIVSTGDPAGTCVVNMTATGLQSTDQIQNVAIRELIWEENN